MAQLERVSPHLQIPDVVICLDKNNRAQPITPYFNALADKFIKYVPETYKHHKMIAFVYGTHSHHILNTTRHMGTLVKKTRQLKLLGYKPIVVSIPFKTFQLNMKMLIFVHSFFFYFRYHILIGRAWNLNRNKWNT